MRTTGKVFALLIILISSVAYAQDQATDVSDDQVAMYKTGLEMGCRDAGRRRGDPVSKVDGFCTCMMSALAASVSHSEWQQAFFHSVRKRDREEMMVLKPHLSKLQACKNSP
jgi:hypothetical protein